MDTLSLIKQRSSTRKYTSQEIPQETLNKILEAGVWGPALHHIQPWKFIVVRKKEHITEIANFLFQHSEKLKKGYNVLLRMTAKTIENSQTLIVVYNTKELQKQMAHIGKTYAYCAALSEIEAIAAAIQNMILVAHENGIGSTWLVMPIFCQKKINTFLKEKGQLIAVLALGFPAQQGIRSPRKPFKETVHFYE